MPKPQRAISPESSRNAMTLLRPRDVALLLTDEFAVLSRLQLQAAEASRPPVVGLRRPDVTIGIAHGRVHGASVEAVVDADVSRQGVVDTFLRLDRQNLAPARHVAGPFDCHHAHVCAATYGDDTIAMLLPAPPLRSA